MHICFAALDYPSAQSGGGVGNQVRTLGHKLLGYGHRVSVVALRSREQPASDDDDGIAVYRVASGNLHWYLGKLPAVGSLLTRAVRELEYSQAVYHQVRAIDRQCPIDLIEATETGAFWLSLGMRKVCQVIRLHGEQYTFHKYTPDLPVTPGLRLSRAVQRVPLRRARLLISPSQAHAHTIRAELGAACPPITIIPNGIDLSRIPPGAQASVDAATVLFVGRLERVKGVLTLLDAAGIVVRACPEARFLLAGAPHPNLAQHEIIAAIQRLGLADHVRLLGHVAWQQLRGWYQQAAICVLPSWYETFGMAALEAMAYGIPVIASDVGGLPEVLAHGRAGLLVPPGDGPALAQAIIGLLRDPVRRRQLGQAGQQHAHAQFSIEQVVGQTLSVYRK